jgi:hypothetical protein
MIFPIFSSFATSFETDKLNYNISVHQWMEKGENTLHGVFVGGIPAVVLNVPVANPKKV